MPEPLVAGHAARPGCLNSGSSCGAGARSGPGARSVAQTALPGPLSLAQPQAADSASTTCRPRPVSAAWSGGISSGRSGPGSMTTQAVSPARRHHINSTPAGSPSAVPATPWRNALVTSSETTSVASSASTASPQLCMTCLVNSRAWAAAWSASSHARRTTGGRRPGSRNSGRPSADSWPAEGQSLSRSGAGAAGIAALADGMSCGIWRTFSAGGGRGTRRFRYHAIPNVRLQAPMRVQMSCI